MTNHKTKYDELVWVLRYKLEPNVIYHLSIFWELSTHTWIPTDEHFICRISDGLEIDNIINPVTNAKICCSDFFAESPAEIKGYDFLNEDLSFYKHNIALCIYGD